MSMSKLHRDAASTKSFTSSSPSLIFRCTFIALIPFILHTPNPILQTDAAPAGEIPDFWLYYNVFFPKVKRFIQNRIRMKTASKGIKLCILSNLATVFSAISGRTVICAIFAFRRGIFGLFRMTRFFGQICKFCHIWAKPQRKHAFL